MRKFAMMFAAALAAVLFTGCGENKTPEPSSAASLPGKALGRADRTYSLNNLKQIGLGIEMFRTSNNDRFPASFDELSSFIDPSVLIAKFDRTTARGGSSYAYIGGGIGNVRSGLADIPVAFEKPSLLPKGQNDVAVLYADGHTAVVPCPNVTGKTCRQTAEILAAKVSDAGVKTKLLRNADAY